MSQPGDSTNPFMQLSTDVARSGVQLRLLKILLPKVKYRFLMLVDPLFNPPFIPALDVFDAIRGITDPPMSEEDFNQLADGIQGIPRQLGMVREQLAERVVRLEGRIKVYEQLESALRSAIASHPRNTGDEKVKLRIERASINSLLPTLMALVSGDILRSMRAKEEPPKQAETSVTEVPPDNKLG